jgi:hypothetical protein
MRRCRSPRPLSRREAAHDHARGTLTELGPCALRPATPADSEFCFQLHKTAMGDYVTAIWGGTSRRDFHARAFNPGRWQIINRVRDLGRIAARCLLAPGAVASSPCEWLPIRGSADRSCQVASAYLP